MKIVLYTGYQSKPFNPNTLKETGLGGTEQSVIFLAEHLSLYNNNEVYVVGDVISGNYDKVKYRTTQEFKQEISYVDTIIGVSYIHYLKEFEDFNYKNSVFWVHNTDYFTWWNGRDIENHRDLLSHPKLTNIICLTYWHKNKFIEQFPEIKDKIVVIGNGINRKNFVDLWDQPVSVEGKFFNPYNSKASIKNPNQYIYTSHAERGLTKVLEDWPLIKAKNPKATLKISTPEYGLEYFDLFYKDKLNNLPDVEFLGTLPQQQLYQLMAESTYWYYPSQYEETFCITALEMLGHKVQPITWEWGGLKETLKGFNTLSEEQKIDWKQVRYYLSSQTWTYVVREYWIKVLLKLNMNIARYYVITLDDNQKLHDKCDSFNVPNGAQKFIQRGFDARRATREDYERFGIRKNPNWNVGGTNNWWNREVTDGEVGCALSHIDIWVESYSLDEEAIIVLEEDFDPKIEIPWHEINDLLEQGYELIYLGRNALKPELETEIEGLNKWVLPDYSYNSHAYILSRSGVQKLVEHYIDHYKYNIFPLDEFLSITFGMTHRQDIYEEYWHMPRLKAAAPKINYIEQSHSQGLSNFNKDWRDEIQIADNWEEWCDKYINPHIRQGQWRLMTDEIGPNVIEFPLFTEKFCDEIVALAEKNEWKTDRHTFYPTTDQTMESLGMQEIYQRVLEQFVYPIWIEFWELTGNSYKIMKGENFIVKYDTINQGSLNLHHDSSIITMNLRLNDEFKGGGTFLPKYKLTIQPRQKGYVMCHPGSITHLHGGRPVIEGTRYILVTFTQNS